MTYTPIEIDENKLTIMGVPFPDKKLFDTVKRGIGTNMFEGIQPTKQDVELIKDCCLGLITPKEALSIAIGKKL